MFNKTYSKSSKIWLKRQIKDKYVIESYNKKLRSRSWFKLDEIQKKEKILKKGLRIIDLGSNPGGWSKYASNIIGKKGTVIACDIMPMKKIDNVEFIQGDLTKHEFLGKFLERCKKEKIEMIMSDMSPKISGISAIDIPNIINLLDIALKISLSTLITKGIFLAKAFQGKDINIFIKKINYFFEKIKILKLKTSRNKSREIYIIAKKRFLS